MALCLLHVGHFYVNDNCFIKTRQHVSVHTCRIFGTWCLMDKQGLVRNGMIHCRRGVHKRSFVVMIFRKPWQIGWIETLFSAHSSANCSCTLSVSVCDGWWLTPPTVSAYAGLLVNAINFYWTSISDKICVSRISSFQARSLMYTKRH